MFKDALAQALRGREDLATDGTRPASDRAPDAPPVAPELPSPHNTDWARLLGKVSPHDSVGKLVQRTSARIKELKREGRGRDAKALERARDSYMKAREKAAWKVVKARWTQLELSPKLYRRLKSEDKVPVERTLERLHTRRAETMRHAAHKDVLEWLSRK